MTEYAAGEIGVTIKASSSKERDEPWLVFRGTVERVRDDIVQAFALSDTDGLTLWEITAKASGVVHGTTNVQNSLGGTILSAKSTDEKKSESADQPVAEEDLNWLIKKLEQAPDVPALKRIWAENKAHFSNASVKDAYSARGKTLAGK